VSWQIEYDPEASKDLRKLDRAIQWEILDYMERHIGRADDPPQFGKPLRGSKFGWWRYRLGDYRIVCQLQNKRLVVLVVSIAPIEPKLAKKRVPGIDKGKIWMADDFDVMRERELEEWYRVDSRLK
jgi:mRNA interferase RelE/StbE